MWFLVKSLQRLIFRNGGSISYPVDWSMNIFEQGRNISCLILFLAVARNNHDFLQLYYKPDTVVYKTE